MSTELPVVVFSDVDGVLGDPHQPAFADAARTLSALDGLPVSLVLCSSKTRAEIESVQQALGIHHPFVCESGGATFVPAGYFGFEVPQARDLAGYQAVEFGRPHADVAQTLRRTAERLRVDVIAFSDMSVDEVARDCQLSLLQARLAKLPEYGERFRVRDRRAGARGRLFQALHGAHLRCIGGARFDDVGDDETDEDAFRAAPGDRQLSVRVGRSKASAARYYVKSQGAVDSLLRTLVAARPLYNGGATLGVVERSDHR